MLQIDCPFCGKREHSEFHYGGAAIDYPQLDAPIEQWHEAVFMRENVRGMQSETWHHVHGCRLWLIVERDTMSHEIKSVRAADAALHDMLMAQKHAPIEHQDAISHAPQTPPATDVDDER